MQVQSPLGESILLAQWPLLVGHPDQYAMVDQLLQPVSQYMPGDAQALLELVETPDPQKTVTQHQQGPAIADHRQGTCQGARLLIQFFPTHDSSPLRVSQHSLTSSLKEPTIQLVP